MSPAIPPSWAMGAVGIDGRGDTHLAMGVHLRVFTSPLVGLPIRPFVVYRMQGDEAQSQLKAATRDSFTFVDSRGRLLSLPFTVTKDNPVTGYIVRPASQRAIAVMVSGGRPDGAKDALSMEAFIDTPQGRRVIGRRDENFYILAAPDIHGIVLSGVGLVRTALWLTDDVSIVTKLDPAYLLDLPVKSAARYEGLPNAEQRAEKRVRIGAPQRLGLHDDPSVSGPAAAASADDDMEWKRVEVLAKDLWPHLDQVLNDLSAPPARLERPHTIADGIQSGAFGQADVASQSAVLSATSDPGLAKWLGYAMVDDDPAALATALTLYYVRGFLPIDVSALGLAERFSLVISGGALAQDLSAPNLPFKVPAKSADGFPVFDFAVPLIVLPGVVPTRPAPPAIGAQLAPAMMVGPQGAVPPVTADGQGPWLADAVPPAARREVVLPLAGLTASPSLAAARADAAGLESLNDIHPATRRAFALVPAVPEDAAVTGTGRLMDRRVPPEAVQYRVAQADWFGRWSEWAFAGVGPKARALPPAPVFDVHYVPASATPVDDAPRFGTLRVCVQVPQPEDLAPGSRLLVRARVDAVIGGVAASATAALASAAQRTLDIVVPGPAGMIARASNVVATVNVRWNDGTIDGPAGEPVQRTLVDPRPPAALALDPALRYSARPDAVGRSRIVLEWPASAGVRYRVYTTDETRLRGALRDMADAGNAGASALLAALATAPTPAHRGQAYTLPSRAGLYHRGLFNNLTAEPLAANASGPMRYSYDLSGSLTVLAFFKVVALSADNVESPFTDAVLLPVAVPSGGPPPRPLLDFAGFTSAGAARLEVTTVRGPQPAARWRLRRSFAESADALRMPIVAEGAVPAATGGDAVVFEIVDAGTDPLAGGALRPWTRITWRVEVQAPSPPGTTLPGEWSAASGAAGGMRVPAAPLAATDLAIDSVTADIATLIWRHPDPLTKGSQGGYRFDIYRRNPGERERLVGSLLADNPTAVSGSGSARRIRFTDPAAAAVGTSWRIVTLDPAGRSSPPSTAVARS